MAEPKSPVLQGFNQHEQEIAKHQPQYKTLPALPLHDEMDTIVTRWELSDEEVNEVIVTRSIYVLIARMGKPLSPMNVEGIWPTSRGDDDTTSVDARRDPQPTDSRPG